VIGIRISGLSRIRIRNLPDRCQNAVDSFYYVVGVIHFAECRDNQSVTVRQMLTNILNSCSP